VERLRRPSAATALAAFATAIALASAWHSGERMWRHLGEQRRVYSDYTDVQRRHAAIDTMGLPSDIFDFYKQYVAKGDRVYFQIRESGFSQYFTLQEAVRAAGRWYLLPALEATDLDDATVVVTFFDDPKLLRARYVTQQQAGVQPIFVSRIKAP
jgi:hypothetical protein